MNNKNSKQVPLRRFPEFSKNDGFSSTHLGSLFKERQEAGFTTLPLLSLLDEKGIVPQSETNRKDNSNSDKSKYLRVCPGDIAYNTMRMWEGRSAYASIEGLISPAYTVCTPTDGVDSRYFAYLFRTERLVQKFRKYSQGLVKDTLNLKYEAFSKIEITYPIKKVEQQKIADCMFSIDGLIEAKAQKLNAIMTHKAGLMQQLFPAEGKAVPELRFPEFRNMGAWSRKSAGNLFSNRAERGSSSLPIYSVTMTDGLVPRSSLDRKIDDIADVGANKTVRTGDLAYNMMRVWQGALGVAPEDCMVSPAYIVLEPQGVNPFFYYFLLKLPQTLRVLTAHSRGLTEDRLRLYFDDFSKIEVFCPSLPEQNKIADCLLSIDKLIAEHEQEVERLKAHKKSLLQQLFPVRDEVQL